MKETKQCKEDGDSNFSPLMGEDKGGGGALLDGPPTLTLPRRGEGMLASRSVVP